MVSSGCVYRGRSRQFENDESGATAAPINRRKSSLTLNGLACIHTHVQTRDVLPLC